MEKVIIVAHTDADGIAAASIISVAEEGMVVDKKHIRFTQPSALHMTLGAIEAPQKLYILDLAIDRQNRGRVFGELSRLSQAGSQIVYIDHHLLTESDLKVLRGLPGITVYHVFGLSTSQLASKWVEGRWQLDEPRLRRIRRLATLGGIADRCVSSRSSKLKEEARILDESWRANTFDNDFRRFLVEELRTGKSPSEIPEAVENYEKAMRVRQQAVESVEKSIFYDGPLLTLASPRVRLHGHVGPSISEIANKRGKITVGLIKPAERRYIIVCARAPDSYRGAVHLGEVLAKICTELGGSGGGHRLAAAGRISLGMTNQFVDSLKSHLGERFRQPPKSKIQES